MSAGGTPRYRGGFRYRITAASRNERPLATGRVPPEVAHPLLWCGTVCRHLGEQDRDCIPGRREVCRCPGPADPAVASDHVPRIDGRDVDRAAEPPALTLEEELPDLALCGRCVVVDHELHGIGREQPVAASGDTSGKQHASEGQPVITGSCQAAIAQGERRRCAPLAIESAGVLQGSGGSGSVV